MKVTAAQQRAIFRLFSAKTWPQRIVALIIVLVGAWACIKPTPSEPGKLTTGMVINGQVVGVADGDTVTVLDDDKKQYKLRLAYIDAPEKAMPFGQAAKKSLSDLVYGQTIQADIDDVDRYGRGVARITKGAQDINFQQVVNGYAWHYTQYAKTQSGSDYSRYQSAQEAAQRDQSGLWADKNPTPPWDWRKAKRNN
ncbi:thermonuclease family protein [Chitinibacter sp. SCUT-21]|uniref:thermonuclease family protein n=1 Tax=Chitinibacter sp. SCUT-21 TaxID=2970891 RepID=UPI0035A612BD